MGPFIHDLRSEKYQKLLNFGEKGKFSVENIVISTAVTMTIAAVSVLFYVQDEGAESPKAKEAPCTCTPRISTAETASWELR